MCAFYVAKPDTPADVTLCYFSEDVPGMTIVIVSSSDPLYLGKYKSGFQESLYKGKDLFATRFAKY